jgi:hypothetical protein
MSQFGQQPGSFGFDHERKKQDRAIYFGAARSTFLKKDPKMRSWYKKIKTRRGSKIARVAVMRRITTIFWHMLTYREAYSIGGPPLRLRPPHPLAARSGVPHDEQWIF